MTFRAWLASIGVVFFLCVGWALASDEEAFFGPRVSAEEGLVRVLNLVSEPVSVALETQIGAKAFQEALPKRRFSPYIRVQSGEARLFVSSPESKARLLATIRVHSGALYTVVVRRSGVSILEDVQVSKRGKALVAFYNFSEEAGLSLKTADGKMSIVPAVGQGASGHRQVNAISLDMGLFLNDVKLATTGRVSLRKDQVINIVVTGSAVDSQIITEFSAINTRI